MAVIDQRNIGEVVESALLLELKQALTENLIKKLVDDFKESAEVIVKAEVERLTVKGIDQARDYANLRDEFSVHFNWK